MELTRFNNRLNFVYDPVVKGVDSDFWSADSGAGLTADTVRNAVKFGDTGAVPASASSYAQFLEGDFEFDMVLDSSKPDSTDSGLYFGLRNVGDTLNRGAVFFDLGYDTTAGDSSPNARPFALTAYDEWGTRRRKHITWDTTWSGNGQTTRFRIRWDNAGYTFLINEAVVGTIGIDDSSHDSYDGINTTIPQHIRISRRSADTLDTSPTALKCLIVRDAKSISGRLD